uniref:Uncharacterized protein n=1 Tax=Oryza punctata TaxID=4537 RepID=A0A0E0KB08_ORYPU
MALEGATGGGGGGGLPGQEAGKKVGWSKEEDKLLRELVRKQGGKDWGVIATAFPGRTDKSCRLRWRQHLDPSVDVALPFSAGEDRKIVELQRVHGNRWATIAAFLPGRSDNAVKNRWNTHLRKRHAQDGQQRPPPGGLGLGGGCSGGGGAGQAAGGKLTPVCLPLFPLTPGFHHKQAPPIGENLPGPARSAVPELLELFPLAPGDLRDNASAAAAAAAAAMDVGTEAVRALTELRLAPAAVVFDAMPLQAIRM